jgi:2-aminoadipate transaminase
MSTVWVSRYAHRAKGVRSSAIRELLKLTEKPGVISFAGGLPSPDAFPSQSFEEACHKVLAQKAARALQYSATEGYEPLRELIANSMARYGIMARVENVMITSGSQQALDLIGKLFINRGDRVLVEAPTYLGALQAFNTYGADYIWFRWTMMGSAPIVWKNLCAPVPNSCMFCLIFRIQPEQP